MAKSLSINVQTIYTLLERLEDAGWLDSEWEREDSIAERHGPLRRLFRLTKDGETRARAVFEDLRI